MAEQIIELEADSLEEAREQMKSRIPEGLHLLSERIIWDGKPQTVQVSADTTEAAFAKAQTLIPVGAEILEKKGLSAPEQKVLTVEANDEDSVEMSAKRTYQIRGASFKNIRLITPGTKGFLGIGKKTNRYEVEALQPAVVSITYRTKAKISAKIGEKKEEAKPAYREQSAPKQQPGGASVFRGLIEDQLKLARYLVTCGKFDHDKLATYIAMAEQIGVRFSPQDKSRLLNPEIHVPILRSDGTQTDTYEQWQADFLREHLVAILTASQMLAKLPLEPANVQIMKKAMDEADEFQRFLSKKGN